jgi:thiamine biosynthesis lipoprotein
MRHVFETMGTVASVIVAGRGIPPLAQIEETFRLADVRFSLYRADSELSRIAAGTIRLEDASATTLDAYSAAIDWRNLTGGAFSPNRPDGSVDLNGIVKAQAIDRAGTQLLRSGFTDWSINVGGDILTSGADPSGKAWMTGIIDPVDGSGLLCSVELRTPRRAIATSGSAERGDHIWLGGQVTRSEFLQATVIAHDIVTADVLATAIIAGGQSTLDDVCDRWDVDVLAVTHEGELLATPGIRPSLAAA